MDVTYDSIINIDCINIIYLSFYIIKFLYFKVHFTLMKCNSI